MGPEITPVGEVVSRTACGPLGWNFYYDRSHPHDTNSANRTAMPFRRNQWYPSDEQGNWLTELVVGDTVQIRRDGTAGDTATCWEENWHSMFCDYDEFTDAIDAAIANTCSRTMNHLKDVMYGDHSTLTDDMGICGPFANAILSYDYERDRSDEYLWTGQSIRDYVASRKHFVPRDIDDAGIDARERFINVGYFLSALKMISEMSKCTSYNFRDKIEEYIGEPEEEEEEEGEEDEEEED